MGFSRQGVRNHTPLALLRQIEEERRLFLWKRDGSLREKEQKRCSFRGLAAVAAATFNTPGASLPEIKRANDRMLLALREIRPEVLPVVVPRENSQVVLLSQVERDRRFRSEATERMTSAAHLAYLNARAALDRIIITKRGAVAWPALLRSASLDRVQELATEAAHAANVVNTFCQ